MKNKPVKMRSQKARKRIKNFSEVALGLNEKEAKKEASRCLFCKKPLCVEGCPVRINIPAFIKEIKNGNFLEAYKIICEDNFLPAVCGRVCPQENQCEKACILSKKGVPIEIGYLERFAADYVKKNPRLLTASRQSNMPANPIKVAVIGSGPAGLTCAGELAKKGYKVTIFEAFHKPGGVMSYGIPAFRLPKDIVDLEIEHLKNIGVEIKCNSVIGRLKTIDQLFGENYRAVFVSVGAGVPKFMGIEGEDLNYVYSANEFLTRVNLMRAYEFPKSDTPIVLGKRVAVIGGGNTAMDAARSALRFEEVKKVTIIYRRSEAEMPARIEEIEHAKEEGIKFKVLTNPKKYIADANKNVCGVECIKMELKEADEGGRPRPVEIPGTEFIIDVDTVIIAIGTDASRLISSTTKDLKINEKDYIVVDENGKTSKPFVYAGGDVVSGSATVIKAMGDGKRIAGIIDEDLKKRYKINE